MPDIISRTYGFCLRASRMTIELKTGLVCDQGLKQRLALDERKFRDVPIGQLQEIESVIDEPHLALAVGHRLRLGEARQP
jgi:hypothetical protein